MSAALTPGAALDPRNYRVTRADLVRYAGASGDFNPIHWSERVATSVGLPGVITQGGAGAGRVRVRGEDWAASWSGERATGEAIRVVRVQGSQLVVEAEPASGGA